MVTRFLRLLFLLVGILLLTLAIPHHSPWNPTNIVTSGEVVQPPISIIQSP